MINYFYFKKIHSSTIKTQIKILSQKLQNYFLANTIEIETLIKPVNPNKNEKIRHGKEITINIRRKEIKSNLTFYTDSNGLHMKKRIIKKTNKTNFDFVAQENYFPVNGIILVNDTSDKNHLT